MRAVTLAVPGDLATPTGGYVYDRRITGELRDMGWTVDVLDLGDGFPFVDEARRAKAGRLLGDASPDQALIVDGLAFGVLPEAAASLNKSHRTIALVHHPLAYESGLPDDRKAALHKSEKDVLTNVRGVIVTSEATKQLVVSEYDVPSDAVAVVRPGHDRVVSSRGQSETISLLAVGSLVPRKGYDVLVAALAMLKDMNWALTIAGDRTRNAETAKQLEQQISVCGLGGRIVLTGAVSDDKLAELYSGASVFVLASRFEGYGMALADATAYGLPVVATNAGAIPEAVPDGAGILVPPDDAAALAAALRRVIGDRRERDSLAAHARTASSHLPTWRDQAMLFARAIESVA